MANSRAATDPKAWRKRNGTELELPSGNVCIVKRPGMEKLLSAGVMPDSLTPIAQEAVQKAQHGGKMDEDAEKKMLAEVMKDQNAIVEMFTTFDRIVEMCVVEPPVVWHMRDTGKKDEETGKPVYEDVPEEERDEDILYTDEVDMDDKTFIFQYVVGGTKDLERFRKEFGAGLADLESGEGVQLSPERVAGDQ